MLLCVNPLVNNAPKLIQLNAYPVCKDIFITVLAKNVISILIVQNILIVQTVHMNIIC